MTNIPIIWKPVNWLLIKIQVTGSCMMETLVIKWLILLEILDLVRLAPTVSIWPFEIWFDDVVALCWTLQKWHFWPSARIINTRCNCGWLIFFSHACIIYCLQILNLIELNWNLKFLVITLSWAHLANKYMFKGINKINSLIR